ncbi:hypothetical protein J6590_104433 [Homalodisca vitripennis]|nr:hypothetical protein J6590_104433 [Homalodisca vitripennis]
MAVSDRRGFCAVLESATDVLQRRVLSTFPTTTASSIGPFWLPRRPSLKAFYNDEHLSKDSLVGDGLEIPKARKRHKTDTEESRPHTFANKAELNTDAVHWSALERSPHGHSHIIVLRSL